MQGREDLQGAGYVPGNAGGRGGGGGGGGGGGEGGMEMEDGGLGRYSML